MISVDTSDALRGLDLYIRDLPREVDKVNREAIDILEKTARTKHRYTTRTGVLERSTIAEELKEKIPGVRLYLKEAMANYGPYVHEGHGRWHADPFIYEAMKENEDRIRNLYDTAFDKTVTKAGL